MSTEFRLMNAALDAIDAALTGERAERFDDIFEGHTPDPSIPRCEKCKSRVLASEALCASCTTFERKDAEDRWNRRRRKIGRYYNGHRRP